MDKSELLALTQQGYDCAQCIVKEFEDVLGEDTGKIIRSVSAMSMGLLQGSICGGILGALAVIGYVCGKETPDYAAQGMCMIKRQMFFMEFNKKYPEITCPGILKLDVRINEDNIKANASGVFETQCPEMFADICSIVRSLIS